MKHTDWISGILSFLIITGSFMIAGRKKLFPQKYKNLEKRISEEVARPNWEPDKYGVIICGKNDNITYKENLSLAYQVLLENGFQKENIYVLDGKGNKSPSYPVDGSASKGTIKKLFNHLDKKIDSNDLLFLYVTDHGEKVKKIHNNGNINDLSTIVIPDGHLLETEMEEYLSQINPKTGILVFDQCYGGGFAKRTGKGKYIGISACESNNVSVSNTFPQAFFNSWKDSTSDFNKDGRTSVKEAFYYAAENDYHSITSHQRPQIYSEIDADEVFLK